MKKVFIGFLFSHLSAASFAQSLNTKKLDSLFDILQNRGLATGSVAISINGNLIYKKAIGFASRENNIIPATVNTRYRIGSISKMFTAVLIFQFIEQNKLSLKDKLSNYFPQLPNADTISISDLLYHRSGLHDYTKDTDFHNWLDKPKTHDELLKITSGKGADFKPGEKYDYCNSNYLVLSYIAEKIGKMTYAELVKENIISKTGLSNTYYGKPIDISKNESQSYKYSDSTWQKQKETDLSIHNGAGSLVSTPADLVKFINQLFQLKLVNESSLESMKTMINGYGMGLFPYEIAGTSGYGHNGRVEEFYSTLQYYPGRQLAVSYITNGILFPRAEIVDGILKIATNEFYPLPFSQSNVGISDKYVGEYAGEALPFKVICKKAGDKLLLEFAGQTLEVEPINQHFFMHLRSGSFFKFDPEKGILKIMETDNVYELRKSS